MKATFLSVLLLFSSAAGAIAAEPAAVTFKAVSRSQSDGFDLARLSNATVRGWAEGDRGRVEFLGEEGDVVGEGSVLLTDGAAEPRIFDKVRRSCRPWAGLGRPSDLPVMPVEGLKVAKVVDESGPEIAGLETRHYRFEISWTAGAVGDAPRWHWTTVEELWAAPALDVPGLALWLNSEVRSTGDPEADAKISQALAVVSGTPLKRLTQLEVEAGERKLATTVTLEVLEVERKTPPEGTFDAPEACRSTGQKVVS